jgi:hypothetical protein
VFFAFTRVFLVACLGGWTLAFACVGGLAFKEGWDGMGWIGMDWKDTMASIGILSGAFRVYVSIICLLF